MIIDAKVVRDLFGRLGASLGSPATLCLIGSAPGIATGQQDRQTPDFDVWHPRSDYDAADLAAACAKTGILYDPKGELEPGRIYIQIVRPGIVRLPRAFDLETIGRYGKLTLVMPPPEIIVASKLVRGTEVDLQDIVWWVRQRGIDMTGIESAIKTLPNERDREAALENATLVRLVVGRGGNDPQRA